MKPYLLCPTCGSDDIVKNGLTRRAKQNYKCRDCGRQFVEDPQWRVIPPDSKVLIERLLLEKLSLATDARVMQVSQDWLQHYVNSHYSTVPQQVQVLAKAKQSLQVQMDELWSFVDDKGNEQWVWLALDTDTREIVGGSIGDRSGQGATALWQSLPGVYRQCAVLYTDHWVSYPVVSVEPAAPSRW